MDYDYEQQEERTQFQDNIVAFNGQEHEDDYYEQTQQHQQIPSGGDNGRKPFLNRDSSSSLSNEGKLFVGGVSWETTADTFTNYFSKYGEITDSVIMTDRHSGRPRGFGFITFADPAVTDKVLEEEHIIDGRAVEVKRTVPREDIDTRGVVRAKKIFVGGIPPVLTADELKEYFSIYGNIVDYQIMLDHNTGRSRGFGFVTFDSEDSVEDIFSEGKTHELGGKRVEIKKAVPKRNGDYGSSTKSRGAPFNNRTGGYDSSNSLESMYAGKMGRDYNGYSGYGGYNGYGGYAGGGYGGSNGFYGGYGGYGYGFGFGGPMMFGNGGYGATGYGAPNGYGAVAGYGSSRGGYGRTNDGASSKAYGSVGAVNGSHGSNKGYSGGSENGSSTGTGRYHPYQK
ncbi:RNA-binding (RRM/RBD/RNP motifs) family protein [Euphorbia peplus]|nr:RNA-binding (RRM/RBD/RNP motifs) family protein [Euphorbia peplus]